MKPPEEVFKRLKDVEFDNSGRPFHSLFYTVFPNYYSLLQEISEKYKNLDKKYMKQARNNDNVLPEMM